MKKILIELILTNKCNKKCNYCDLNFKNKSLSFDDLDLFINFLKNNKANYTINFFGGEPLLEYDKLIYFVEKSNGLIKNYSIGTNGLLLNKEKLDFCKKNNIKIHLSIDNISLGRGLDLELISKYQEIICINFINSPDYLDNSIDVFNDIKNKGFKNIAFMPVFNTKKWDKSGLSHLKQVLNYVKKNCIGINLETYSYFNGISIDKQFILDTDLYFYSDLDSLLWIQKQFQNIDIDLKNIINNQTKLISLTSNKLTLQNLISMYNIDEILKLVFEIPKTSGDLLSYKVIDKILDNGAEKR